MKNLIEKIVKIIITELVEGAKNAPRVTKF